MIDAGMGEVIALENEIMAALPKADELASITVDAALIEAVRFAQDVLCNAWTGPGLRLDRLRSIAGTFRSFLP